MQPQLPSNWLERPTQEFHAWGEKRSLQQSTDHYFHWLKREAFFISTPALFGANFGKRSKEYLDQVRAMRLVIPQRSASEESWRTFYKPRGHSSPVHREQYTCRGSHAHRGWDRTKGARSEIAVRICSHHGTISTKTTMHSLWTETSSHCCLPLIAFHNVELSLHRLWLEVLHGCS